MPASVLPHVPSPVLLVHVQERPLVALVQEQGSAALLFWPQMAEQFMAPAWVSFAPLLTLLAMGHAMEQVWGGPLLLKLTQEQVPAEGLVMFTEVQLLPKLVLLVQAQLKPPPLVLVHVQGRPLSVLLEPGAVPLPP